MATTSKQQIKSIKPAIEQLHKAFDKANEVLFNSELPQVVLTMNPRGKTHSLGWFTINPAWENGNEEFHEINISPETLNRDYVEVIQTLVHEMVHLYNHVNGIKDVSRGYTYHNKRFLKTAEEHGFEYVYNGGQPDAKIGYSAITFTKETANIVKFWNIDKTAFTIVRKEFTSGGKEKKKSNIRKYVCGCGTIIRASKEVRVQCMDCETMFEEEVAE